MYRTHAAREVIIVCFQSIHVSMPDRPSHEIPLMHFNGGKSATEKT